MRWSLDHPVVIFGFKLEDAFTAYFSCDPWCKLSLVDTGIKSFTAAVFQLSLCMKINFSSDFNLEKKTHILGAIAIRSSKLSDHPWIVG